MAVTLRTALPLALLLLAVVGCATAGRPIHASAMPGEDFTGTVVGPADGDGTVTLASTHGVKCSGTYTHIKLGDKPTGIGNLELKCDDGRTGGVIVTNPSGEIAGVGTLGKSLFLLNPPQ